MRLQRAERSLERALGVVGRRGYELVSISASREKDGQQLFAHLELEGRGSPETLVRQLQKLHEVEHVVLEDASPKTPPREAR